MISGVIFLIEQTATGLYILIAVGIVLALRSWQRAGSAYRGTYFELEKDMARYRRGNAFTVLILLVEAALLVVGVQRVVAPTLRQTMVNAPPLLSEVVNDGDFRTPIPPTFSPSVIDASNVQLGEIDPAQQILPTPTLTPTPVGTIVPNAPPAQCGSPDVQLQIPANGMIVFEPIAVVGVVTTDNFAFYRFELKGEFDFREFCVNWCRWHPVDARTWRAGAVCAEFLYTGGVSVSRLGLRYDQRAARIMHSDDLHQRANPDADAARYGDSKVRPTLAVVGAGKVGGTLTRLSFAHGYSVATVYSRTEANATALAREVGARTVTTLDHLQGDLALIAVPDDAIAATVDALAGFSGQAVIHTSGAHDASMLAPLAARGLLVGSLHPAYPFADGEAAVKGLSGVTFALEAQDDLLRYWLYDLIDALGGRPLLIPPGGKATYHAALVIASNYTVTLYALAESLLLGIGADRAAADQALNALLLGTVENLRAKGIPDALTGPLVRADTGTIAAHLRGACWLWMTKLAEVYRQLGRLTYPLLLARGIAPDEIERLFEQELEHANNSP